MWMRSLTDTLWNDCSASLVEEHLDAFWIIRLSRDQNLQIIGEGNQSSIEHPVHGSGKGHAIRQNIWSVGFDRADMRRVDH